jgi:hypothetical protein
VTFDEYGLNSTLTVRIRNNQGGTIHGIIEPIAPLEMWPAALTGGLSIAGLAPRVQPFSLAPGASGELTFSIPATMYYDRMLQEVNEPFHSWIMVKIMYNGEMSYFPVAVDRPGLKSRSPNLK